MIQYTVFDIIKSNLDEETLLLLYSAYIFLREVAKIVDPQALP